MDHYKPLHGYHQPSSAPEVAHPSTLEVATPESEGLQMVQPANANQPGYSYHYADKPNGGPFATSQQQPQPKREKKRIVIIAIIAALICLAVGVGVGVGVGLSVGKSSKSGNQTASPAKPGGNAPSATTSAVPTGPTTGVAAYTCQNQSQIISSTSVHYVEDCKAAYLTGGPDMYDSSNTIANLANPPYTRYNLADCLAVCDEWNANGENSVPCRAVTYYANLTQAYGNGWFGNCFVKNGRPESVSRSGTGIDWEHTVSAYMSCLVNGGCG